MSLAGFGRLLEDVAERRRQDIIHIRNGKQVTIMGAVRMSNCSRCRISCEHVNGICTGCGLPWLPPVPRGLSSGVQSAADIERYRNGKQVVVYPDRRPLGPQGNLQYRDCRMCHGITAQVNQRCTKCGLPRDFSESLTAEYIRNCHAVGLREIPRQRTFRSPAIAGLPDCRGVACDGMCGNPDCVGDQALRRTAARIRPWWRIAVAVVSSVVIVAVVVALPLHAEAAFPLVYVASSVLFTWAFMSCR